MIRRFLLPWLALAACAPPKEPAWPPTWQRDVRPLVESKCAACHKQGGIGPFAFASSQDVRAMGVPVRDAVTQHIMPPWPAASSCTQYAPEGSLTQAQLTTLTGWLDNGAPEGEAADYVPSTDPQPQL